MVWHDYIQYICKKAGKFQPPSNYYIYKKSFIFLFTRQNLFQCIVQYINAPACLTGSDGGALLSLSLLGAKRLILNKLVTEQRPALPYSSSILNNGSMLDKKYQSFFFFLSSAGPSTLTRVRGKKKGRGNFFFFFLFFSPPAPPPSTFSLFFKNRKPQLFSLFSTYSIK